MHKALVWLMTAGLVSAGLVACSSDDTTGDDDGTTSSSSSGGSSSSSGAASSSSSSGGSSSSSGGSSSSSSSGGSSSSSGGSSSSSGSSSGGATVRLTIDNYLAWCQVAVDGAASSTENTITVDVAPGTVVQLDGDTKNATFVWGYWYGTDGDTTAAHDRAMMTQVTVEADATIQACCPFANAPDEPCPAP